MIRSQAVSSKARIAKLFCGLVIGKKMSRVREKA